MIEQSYEIKIETPDWKLIVIAESEEEAQEKMNEYLQRLFTEDGFSYWASEAQQSVKAGKYTIVEFAGFVVK